MSRPFASAPSTNLPPAPNQVGPIGIDAMSLHPAGTSAQLAGLRVDEPPAETTGIDLPFTLTFSRTWFVFGPVRATCFA